VKVAITELRAHLSTWVERARGGEDVVITERGLPVARLVAVDAESVLERLVREGVVDRPVSADKPRSSEWTRARPHGSVSEFISEQRR
jgi:prevent-host-death family protein